MSTHVRNYREIFLEHNPPRPWKCFFCSEMVTASDVWVVHHIDENHTNNDPINLTAAHLGCHSKHHNARPRRKPFTREHRENLSKAMTGRKRGPMSDVAREAIAAGQRKRWARHRGEIE